MFWKSVKILKNMYDIILSRTIIRMYIIIYIQTENLNNKACIKSNQIENLFQTFLMHDQRVSNINFV